MTLTLTRSLLLSALCASAACPQINPADGAVRHARPEHGVVHATATPLRDPPSVKELLREADLAADCAVESVLPSRRANPRIPTSIETDSILTVTRVLKGTADAQQILVSQMGGKIGDLEKIVAHEALMQKGDRYVLFLNVDKRPAPPDAPRLPRFIAVGIWAGRFKIQDAKVVAPELAPPEIRGHDGQPADAFLGEIERIR